MSFTVRNSQENTATGSTSLTITKPTGLTVGDLMVAAIGKDDDPAVTGIPSGWTKVAGQNTSTGNDITSWLGYKVADSADVAASDFTWSGDSEDWSGTITAFIPGNSNPVFVAASTDAWRSNDVSPESNSLSTTSGNLLVGYCTSAQNDTGGLGTATAGYTDAGNPSTGSGNGDNGSILAYDLSGPGGTVTYEANNAESTAESHPYLAEFSDIAAPIIEQKAFRFRDGTDAVGLNVDSNWGAALNVDLTGIFVDTNYDVRLRVLLENDSGTEAIPSTGDYQLRSQLNGEGYNPIDTGFGVDAALSGQYVDGDPTTQVIGSGTFVAGDGVEGSAIAADRALGTNSETEHEWMIRLVSAELSDGDVIDFQVWWRENAEAWKPPNTVTQIPSVTVEKTPFGPQLTSLTFGSSVSAASTVDTASITPTGDNLILAAIDSTFITDLPNEPTASGNGLTWVVVRTFGWDTSGTTRRFTLFRAMGSSPSTGAITFDFSGQSQTEFRWSIVEYADVDTGGTNGANAVVQNVQDPATVVSVTAIAAVLATFADSNNATYGAAAKEQAGDADMVGDSAMVTVHDFTDANSDSRLFVQKIDGAELTVDWSWGTVRRAVGFALEIATAVTAGQTIAIDAATETEVAQVIVPIKPITEPVGNAVETETAQVIIPLKPIIVPIGVATESETPGVVSAVKSSLVNAVTEIEVAEVIAAVKPITVAVNTATEVEIARAIAALKLAPIGAGIEVEVAQVIAPVKPITAQVGAATEIETAQVVGVVQAGSAVAKVQSNSGFTSTSTVTVTWDTAPSEDNLMVVKLWTKATSITLPSGWTADAEVGAGDQHSSFSKVAGPSEGTSQEFVLSAADQSAWATYELSGVNTTTPVRAAATEDTTGDTTSRSSGTTGSSPADGDYAIAAFGSRADISAQSFTNSFTLDENAQTPSNVAEITTAFLAITGSGAVETTMSWTTSVSTRGLVVVYAAAAAGPQIVAVGAATETELAQTVVPVKPIIVPVTASIESETAQPVIPLKPIITSVSAATEIEVVQVIVPVKPITEPVGSATETELAQVIASIKPIIVPTGAATESETAGTVSATKSSLVNVVTEVEVAQPIAALKPITVPVNVVTESEVAEIIDPSKAVAIGTVTETELARAITPVKPIITSVDVATETELAQVIVPVKPITVPVNPATEIETAQLIAVIQSMIVAVTAAVESETANTIIPVKPIIVEISSATETELAQVITPVQAIIVSVNSATESELARTITALKPINVSILGVSETELAKVITPVKPINVSILSATESEAAQAIVPMIGVSIGTATEIELARIVSAVKPIFKTISAATESEIAQIIIASKPKIVPIGTAVEVETAQLIAVLTAQIISIGTATESELARVIAAVKPIIKTIGTATEIEIAQVIATVLTQIIPITAATESELANIITAVKFASVVVATEIELAHIIGSPVAPTTDVNDPVRIFDGPISRLYIDSDRVLSTLDRDYIKP